MNIIERIAKQFIELNPKAPLHLDLMIHDINTLLTVCDECQECDGTGMKDYGEGDTDCIKCYGTGLGGKLLYTRDEVAEMRKQWCEEVFANIIDKISKIAEEHRCTLEMLSEPTADCHCIKHTICRCVEWWQGFKEREV